MKQHNGPGWYLAGLLTLLLSAGTALAQQEVKPASSPATTSGTSGTATPADTHIGNYNVVSSLEIGVRGLSVSGSDNKYRSDLNYSPGVRLFDSSFFLRSGEKRGGLFDEFLV